MRAIHWFGSDLRIEDDTALAAACRRAGALALVFVPDAMACSRGAARTIRVRASCPRVPPSSGSHSKPRGPGSSSCTATRGAACRLSPERARHRSSPGTGTTARMRSAGMGSFEMRWSEAVWGCGRTRTASSSRGARSAPGRAGRTRSARRIDARGSAATARSRPAALHRSRSRRASRRRRLMRDGRLSRTCTSTGARGSAGSCAASSTATPRATTAAGNGRPRRARTPGRTCGSSIRPCRTNASTPTGSTVRRWIPELAGMPGKSVHRPWASPLRAPACPPPIVDHRRERTVALARHRAVRGRRGR